MLVLPRASHQPRASPNRGTVLVCVLAGVLAQAGQQQPTHVYILDAPRALELAASASITAGPSCSRRQAATP
jgi:hypothetical protein